MTTVLDIANRALSAVGARSGSAGSVSALSSLNEQSNEAYQINLLYASTRDDLLRAAHWNFCRRTAILSLLKSAPGTPESTVTSSVWTPAFPAPPWLYEYAYPSDCIKMRSLTRQVQYATGGGGYAYSAAFSPAGGGDGNVRFIVASDQDVNGNPINVVLCNADKAIGVYTARIINPDQWDSNFQQTVVSALGARLVIPLSGDKSLKQELMQEAQMNVMNARVNDGNEGTTSVEREADWIMARGYSGDWRQPGGFMAGWDSVAWLGI